MRKCRSVETCPPSATKQESKKLEHEKLLQLFIFPLPCLLLHIRKQIPQIRLKLYSFLLFPLFAFSTILDILVSNFSGNLIDFITLLSIDFSNLNLFIYLYLHAILYMVLYNTVKVFVI